MFAISVLRILGILSESVCEMLPSLFSSAVLLNLNMFQERYKDFVMWMLRRGLLFFLLFDKNKQNSYGFQQFSSISLIAVLLKWYTASYLTCGHHVHALERGDGEKHSHNSCNREGDELDANLSSFVAAEEVTPQRLRSKLDQGVRAVVRREHVNHELQCRL